MSSHRTDVRRSLDLATDLELLTELLSCGGRRADAAALAGELLAHHSSLGAALCSDDPLMNEAMVRRLELMREVGLRVLRDRMRGRRRLSSWTVVASYLRARLAHEPREHLRLLHLDLQNGLIADELMAIGSLAHVPVYPREVARSALQRGAARVIMVHNHPSGRAEASPLDLEMTEQVRVALAAIGIELVDHYVVAGRAIVSCREQSLVSQGLRPSRRVLRAAHRLKAA